MLPITIDLSVLATLINDSLSAGLNSERIEPAPVDVGFPTAITYDDPDSLLNPFPPDAVVVGEASKTVYRWQDNWQPREIIVQKLYSESYDASWTNAYVPDGTFVFMRGQDMLDATQPMQGLTKADGTDYFWVQSGMTSGRQVSQACVSLPIFSVDMGHDLYDHLCTDFS